MTLFDEAVLAAIAASVKSPCSSKRGVAIWHPGGLISTGNNNMPVGFACTRDARCRRTCSKLALHAEENALIDAGREARGAEMLHVKTIDDSLAASGEPSCGECSKQILAAGIVGMWLYHATGWKRYDANEFHRLTVEHVLATYDVPA